MQEKFSNIDCKPPWLKVVIKFCRGYNEDSLDIGNHQPELRLLCTLNRGSFPFCKFSRKPKEFNSCSSINFYLHIVGFLFL